MRYRCAAPVVIDREGVIFFLFFRGVVRYVSADWTKLYTRRLERSFGKVITYLLYPMLPHTDQGYPVMFASLSVTLVFLFLIFLLEFFTPNLIPIRISSFIQRYFQQDLTTLRACLDATVPFRSPIQIALFLPFRNGEKPIFTAETVAERNGPIFGKQALSLPLVARAVHAGAAKRQEDEATKATKACFSWLPSTTAIFLFFQFL